MNANPLAAYRETRVKTASPGQLVVMLYDEAIKQSDTAIGLFGADVQAQTRAHRAHQRRPRQGSGRHHRADGLPGLRRRRRDRPGPLRPLRLVRPRDARGQHPQGSRPRSRPSGRCSRSSAGPGPKPPPNRRAAPPPPSASTSRAKGGRHGRVFQRGAGTEGRGAQALPRAPRPAEGQVRELPEGPRFRASRHRVGRCR